ncbi:MFS transporter [Nonomuraea sp. NPDC002799]
MLVLSAVVVFLDKALLGLVAKPMSAELGMSAAGFGSLGSASYVLFGATCIAVSFAAQRISPRWVLLVCGLLWAAGQVPAIVAATGGMLYASRILVGAAEGPASPLSMTVLYSWFPNERRGLPQALYTAGASVAKIAMAPLLTLVIIGFGWLPSYSENALGFSAQAAGSLFGLPSALGIVALVVTGAATDRLLRAGVTSRRARGLLGGACLTGAGVLLAVAGVLFALLVDPERDRHVPATGSDQVAA